MIGSGTRVAVVDDVPPYAATAAGIAEEAGLVPTIIEARSIAFEAPSQLITQVREENCTAAICDHRLSYTGYAAFTGAELVSRLYQERIPAVLLSTFSSIDEDTSIRLHRFHIPSLVDRNHLAPNQIIGGLRKCESEFDGVLVPEREPWRTLVRIEGISQESETIVADAIVHTWDPDRAVRFPLDLIEDLQIRSQLTANDTWPIRLFANVNVGCQDGSELFFREFEEAPTPDMNNLAI